MSKNITIQEGGVGKQLIIGKLKTDLAGGVISPEIGSGVVSR